MYLLSLMKNGHYTKLVALISGTVRSYLTQSCVHSYNLHGSTPLSLWVCHCMRVCVLTVYIATQETEGMLFAKVMSLFHDGCSVAQVQQQQTMNCLNKIQWTSSCCSGSEMVNFFQHFFLIQWNTCWIQDNRSLTFAVLLKLSMLWGCPHRWFPHRHFSKYTCPYVVGVPCTPPFFP